MSLCVGIDLSTKRLDFVAIPLDPEAAGRPWVFTLEVISTRSIRNGTQAAIGFLEDRAQDDIVTVAIEKPAGRFVHPSLHETFGAITASIPGRVKATTGLYPVEWRQAIGCEGKAKNSKAAGNDRVRELYPQCVADEWDEHNLDALGIATAWRNLQWLASPA